MNSYSHKGLANGGLFGRDTGHDLGKWAIQVLRAARIRTAWTDAAVPAAVNLLQSVSLNADCRNIPSLL